MKWRSPSFMRFQSVWSCDKSISSAVQKLASAFLYISHIFGYLIGSSTKRSLFSSSKTSIVFLLSGSISGDYPLFPAFASGRNYLMLFNKLVRFKVSVKKFPFALTKILNQKLFCKRFEKKLIDVFKKNLFEKKFVEN